jgi:hypothetical protein
LLHPFLLYLPSAQSSSDGVFGICHTSVGPVKTYSISIIYLSLKIIAPLCASQGYSNHGSLKNEQDFDLAGH